MTDDRKKHDTHDRERRRGVTRRGFLGSLGTGAATVAVASQVSAEQLPDAEQLPAGDVTRVTLDVNGRRRDVLVEPRWSLAFVLRDKLGLTGTKPGCERGECGACTVLIGGVPRYACMTLAVEAQGAEITTVEGLMDGEAIGPVQEAFVEKDAFQCGYCTSGQIMAAEGLLRANGEPNLEEIRTQMSGNLCRCGTYAHIFQAVGRAAELKRGEGGAS
jgi:xanthine dehydrogenase YagT iron-sulfur-binding subunit